MLPPDIIQSSGCKEVSTQYPDTIAFTLLYTLASVPSGGTASYRCAPRILRQSGLCNTVIPC